MNVKDIQIKASRGQPMVLRASARLIEGVGLEGNCHQGGTRQVSLMAAEASAALSRLQGTGLCLEKYAANLITEALDYGRLQPGENLAVGSAVLELTEVGKPCHFECALFQQKSACPLTIMSAFAVVIRGGQIEVGDLLRKV